MSAHAYTGDQLVEQPAIGLSADLGWQTVSAMDNLSRRVLSRRTDSRSDKLIGRRAMQMRVCDQRGVSNRADRAS